jgi:hypothetical protein
MTIFDEDGSQRDYLETLPDWVQYLAYGDEVTLEGRKHYHCFLYTDKVRFSQFNARVGNAYRAPMKGTFKDNQVYCSKQSTMKEFGEGPEQEASRDLLNTKRKLEESRGKNIYGVAEDEEYFGCIAKHSRFMQSYMDFNHGKHTVANEAVEVIYCCGPPGSEKT